MTTPDLVIGLDSSTQSTKAIAWNREGTAIAEGRAPHDMTMPQPGHVEQDSGQWWEALLHLGSRGHSPDRAGADRRYGHFEPARNQRFRR